MRSQTIFWDQLSPLLLHIEDIFGINLNNLGPIIQLIKSPVLVIGAGQGLLVEELRQKGYSAEGVDFSPEMVAYAEKRRGIKLIQANANDMPFQDNQFKTSIVATGVIDFMDNTDQIGAIINEVKRVTDNQGEIFIAFISHTPQGEEFYRYIGAISDDDRLSIGNIFKFIFTPREVIADIRKDPSKSTIGLILRFIKSYMAMPKKARARLKSVRELRNKNKKGELGDIRGLLDNLPKPVPYRKKEQIDELFKALKVPLRNIFILGNCNIVQL